MQAVFLLAGMYTWADWPVKISVNSMLLAQYNVIDCIASHIYEEQKHDREVKAAHWRMTCQVLAYCTRPCVPPWVPANHSTGNILNLQLAEHKLVDGTTGNSRSGTSTSTRPWVPTGHPSVKRPSRRFTDLIITVTTALLQCQRPTYPRPWVIWSIQLNPNAIRWNLKSSGSKWYSNSTFLLNHEIAGCMMSDCVQKKLRNVWQ